MVSIILFLCIFLFLISMVLIPVILIITSMYKKSEKEVPHTAKPFIIISIVMNSIAFLYYIGGFLYGVYGVRDMRYLVYLGILSFFIVFGLLYLKQLKNPSKKLLNFTIANIAIKMTLIYYIIAYTIMNGGWSYGAGYITLALFLIYQIPAFIFFLFYFIRLRKMDEKEQSQKFG